MSNVHQSNYDFKKDIKLGDIAEQKVLEILHKKGNTDAYKVPGNEPRWDILVPSLNTSFEVKNDLRALTSGNLAIEIGHVKRGNSGINVCQADWWISFVGQEAFIVETKVLREFIMKPEFRTVLGGDRNKATNMCETYMKLVPLSTLKAQDFFRKFI